MVAFCCDCLLPASLSDHAAALHQYPAPLLVRLLYYSQMVFALVHERSCSTQTPCQHMIRHDRGRNLAQEKEIQQKLQNIL
jgi:hypothetical protein